MRGRAIKLAGPERHAADESPEQIVQHLIAEHELRLIARHPFVGVFEIGPLGPEHMKAQVPGPPTVTSSAGGQHHPMQAHDPSPFVDLKLSQLGRPDSIERHIVQDDNP